MHKLNISLLSLAGAAALAAGCSAHRAAESAESAEPVPVHAISLPFGHQAAANPQPADPRLSAIEADSAGAIHARLLADFPYTIEEGAALMAQKYPGFTVDSLRRAAALHYIEIMEIDSVERMHRKAVRNIGLLDPARNGGWRHRGWNASAQRQAYADSIIRHSRGQLPDGGAHRVVYRFAIDVPTTEAIAGDTLRVWMPFPMETPRQSHIRLLSAEPGRCVISDPTLSPHRTIFFEAPVSGDTTHFEYTAELVTRGVWFDPDSIRAGLYHAPALTEQERARYTAFDGPHYVRLDSLAAAITGDVTDPYQQSELVYDYIIDRFPWAGAREYSTIPCIPLYVQQEHHGDCGQVALLYISLMRTLGVPARWESGWMLHPGEKNLHDWAEVYLPGAGWVPVDVSFGRYTPSSDPAVQKFYSTGIDSYRLAANSDVCGPFFPPKRFIRSETVDSQVGEVECSRGNLFYPAWDQELEIISVKSEK